MQDLSFLTDDWQEITDKHQLARLKAAAHIPPKFIANPDFYGERVQRGWFEFTPPPFSSISVRVDDNRVRVFATNRLWSEVDLIDMMAAIDPESATVDFVTELNRIAAIWK